MGSAALAGITSLLFPLNTLIGESAEAAVAETGTTSFLSLDVAGLDLDLDLSTCAKEGGGLKASAKGSTSLETGGGGAKEGGLLPNIGDATPAKGLKVPENIYNTIYSLVYLR